MNLDFEDVNSVVMAEPRWLFSTMHNDANLPSTVLKGYSIVFDYPKQRLTIAEPGSIRPCGERVPSEINFKTGIVQIDAVVGKDSLGFALDNGASYSFVSEDVLEQFSQQYSDRLLNKGAVGCANIWGWWPDESRWPVIRIPEIRCGSVTIEDVGLVGLPAFFPNGMGLGEWYSLKASGHVVGFLGPNAFKAFRIEIDYADNAVYFKKEGAFDTKDMDLVGLTLRPLSDGNYQVIGVVEKDGKPVVEGVEPGDILLQIDNFKTTGATMGRVVDALRGKQGKSRTLILDRDGQRLKVDAVVMRLL